MEYRNLRIENPDAHDWQITYPPERRTECTRIGPNHIFIVHIAQKYIRSCISSVTRITQFKTHVPHITGYLFIWDSFPSYERLFYYYFEITFLISSKTNYIHNGFRKVSIVKGYSIKGNDWLYEIVKTFFTQWIMKTLFDIIYPNSYRISPYFNS